MGASGTLITRRIFEALPELRYISKFGIGVDSIDIDAATEHGVLVANTPEDSQVTTVCEHAIALMLALKEAASCLDAGIHAQWRLAWNGELIVDAWRYDRHRRPRSALGAASPTASRLGRAILAYDPYTTEAMNSVTLTDLTTLLESSDIVTLHASPTAENHHLINGDTLARMRPSAILVNTGRGSLVDYSALNRRSRAAPSLVRRSTSTSANRRTRRSPVLHAECHLHAARRVWTWDGVQNVGWHGARNLWAMISGEGDAGIVNPRARLSRRS